MIHVGARIRKFGRELTSHQMAVYIIAALITVGGASYVSNYQAVKAEAANLSASGGKGLKDVCAKAGVKMPKVARLKMFYPGRKIPPRMQTVVVTTKYQQLPQECNGKYRRSSYIKAQLQNNIRPRRWINLDPAIKWRELFPYDASSDTGGNKSGTGGTSIGSNGHEGDRVYYKCSPGKRKTRARAFFRNQVRDLRTGAIVAQKIIKRPVKIRGGGC